MIRFDITGDASRDFQVLHKVMMAVGAISRDIIEGHGGTGRRLICRLVAKHPTPPVSFYSVLCFEDGCRCVVATIEKPPCTCVVADFEADLLPFLARVICAAHEMQSAAIN